MAVFLLRTINMISDSMYVDWIIQCIHSTVSDICHGWTDPEQILVVMGNVSYVSIV